MFYGSDPEIKALQASANITEQVQILNTEVADLKEQLQLSKERLYVAHSALRDVTNEKQLLQKKNSVSQKKLNKCKEVESILMESNLELYEQNIDLSEAISAMESELCSSGHEQICILVMRTLHFKLNVVDNILLLFENYIIRCYLIRFQLQKFLVLSK